MDTIFISYRREESAGHAGRIYDRLREKFGKDRVFMDVSAIEPGVDFVEAIDRAVGACAVLLVVIGRNWLACTDAAGRRRLDDPKDFIRLEVGTALRRNIRVVPVLVQGAAMPGEEGLPEELKLLARRNAIEINDTHWDSDLAQLVETLERVLSGGTVPPPAATGSAQAKAPPPGRKSRLTWLISSITAVVLALTGLLTGIESFRNAFVRMFKGTPAVTTTITSPPPGTTVPSPSQGPTTPTTATVPNVVGLPEQEAVGTLRDAGFSSSTEQRISPDDRPGTVFHQEPPAGTSLGAGAGVILHVATAPAPPPPKPPPATKQTVPDIVGQTQDTARSILKKKGFSVEVAGEHESSDVPAGSVLRTFPKAGDKLERGGKVRLVLATKPRESVLVNVPNVVKQPLERAVKMLTEAGLQLGEKSTRPVKDISPGTVLAQKVKEGSQVKRGTRVDLLVAAKAPETEQATLPNVVRLPLEKAVQILTEAGLQPGEVTRRENAKARPGTVFMQQVRGESKVKIGSQLKRGTRVDLWVAMQPAGEVPAEETPPVAQPRKVLAEGSLKIRQTYLFDLDGGKIVNNGDADLWFEAETETESYLTPRNGATIGFTREKGDYESCSRVKMTERRIPISKLPMNSYACVRTSRGNLAAVMFVKPAGPKQGPSPTSLLIKYIVWE